MDQADERPEKSKTVYSSVVARLVSIFDRESVWNRNFGWQLLAFATIILGGGYYVIFINSPIKPTRFLPRIPKTYGNRWQPETAASSNESDNDEPNPTSLRNEQNDTPGTADRPTDMTDMTDPPTPK